MAKAARPRTVTGQSVRQVRPKRRKRHYVRNFFLTLLFLIILMVVAALATFLVVYATTEIPKPAEFARAQVTSVYYSDGATEIGKFAEVNREIIETKDLPKQIGNAVVASEDRTFWTNSGVDLRGIARAFLNNARGGATQGASTLSQQYVERYYMAENTNQGNMVQRYWAKAKEAIMALKINRQQEKDEILGNYLNTIYFGRGSYGIQAAAKAYFGKNAQDIDYSEAALLSGIIPAPSAYDPAVNQEIAEKRWKRVIKNMAADGYITPEQQAAAQFPATIPPTQSVQDFGGVNGYFMFQARQELKDLAGLTEEQIDTMGLKIITTLDKDKVRLMMDTVAKLPAGHAPNLHVAMISTDPTTGEIIAEYPGQDYLKVQINAATQEHFQAGSTFKPFGMIASLEQGGSLSDTYPGNSPQTIQGVPIRNFGGGSYGTVSLAQATAKSINTAYVALNAKVGPSLTKEVAIRLGYPEDTPGLDNSLTNVLGSASPTAANIAEAYGTIANQGKRETVHMIRQVMDTSGDIVYMPSFSADQVIDRIIALTATQALTGSFQAGGTATKAQIGRPSAGKTGSSTDNKSAVFAGFIPQVVTIVGLYQSGPNGEEESISPFGGIREVTGSTWPAWLWRQYMSGAVKGLEVEQFAKAQKLKKVEVTRSEEPSPTETEPSLRPSPDESLSPSQSPSPAPAMPRSPGNLPSNEPGYPPGGSENSPDGTEPSPTIPGTSGYVPNPGNSPVAPYPVPGGEGGTTESGAPVT